MQNILNRIIKTSICSLVFLLPLFWLPFSFEAFEFNKQYLLFFLVSVAFLTWISKMVLVDKEIRFRYSLLDIFVLAFLLIATLSAVFSVDRTSGLFGFYGRFSNGLVGILSLGIFYFLITNNVSTNSEQKTKNKSQVSSLLAANCLLKVFSGSVFFVILITYFSIFGIWQKILSIIQLPIVMQQRIFNPAAGSLEGLAVFLAVIIAFLASSFVVGIKEKRGQLAAWLLILSSLFLLIIIDFKPAWLVVLAYSVLFVGFSLWKRIFRENVNRLLLPIFLTVIAVFFVFADTAELSQGLAPGIMPDLAKEQVLGQDQSWIIGFKAAIENIKSGFLGSGTGTFNYDFSKFKSVSFNQSPLWQIRFDRAGSHLAEILGTMGFLGFISFLALIAMFLFMSWRFLQIFLQKFQIGQNLLLPLLMAFIALFFGQLFYYQNAVLAFTFWLFLGLSVVLWREISKTGWSGEKTFSFKDFPELSLVFSVLLIIIGLSFLAMYYFGARFYLADVNYRKAIISAQIPPLEKAARLNPFQPQYKILLGRAYLNEAILEMQKPADLIDQNVLAENAYRAIAYLKGGELNGFYVKGATEIAPNRVTAWETLAVVYRDIRSAAGGVLEWGIKSFNAAVSLEPANPVLHTELGKLYLASGDTEQAKKEFEKVKQLKPDYVDATIQMALVYERENNLEQAIKEMESVVQVYPFYVDAVFNLGRLYFNNGQIDQAISQFEKAVDLSPNHSNAIYSLGVAYQANGEREKALDQFYRVLELNPGNPDVEARIEELRE